MSIKLIFCFFLLVVITTYFAFLNPDEFNIRFTQTLSIDIPPVVFLLGSTLLGVLTATLVYWSHGIRRVFEIFRLKNSHRRQIGDLESMDNLYQKAKEFFLAGSDDKARKLFEKVLIKNSKHIGALYHLGAIFGRIRRFKEAQKLYYKAANLAPKNIKILYGLADSYISMDLFDEGLDVLERIRKIDASITSPLYKIRNIQVNQKYWDKAYVTQKLILKLLDDEEKLGNEKNELSKIIYSKGMEFYDTGDKEGAISEMKRVLRENTRSIPAYITLGDVYLEIKDSKRAIKAWKSGLDNTGAPVFLQKICKTYTTQNYSNDVVKIYQKAIKSTDRDNKEVLQLILGTYFLDQNAPQKAIELLTRDENHLSLFKRILLNWAYESKNLKEEARKIFQDLFKQTRESILGYTCDFCWGSSEEWSAFCPRCKTWDSFIQGPNFDRISEVNSHSKETSKKRTA